MQNVIALIAAYNEENAIGKTVESLKKIPSISGIIVVDDGSTDKTIEEAEMAGAYVIAQDQNRGKGAALTLGMSEILADDDDIILLIDADIKDGAIEAEKLLSPIMENEADYTIAKFKKSKSGGGFGIVKFYANFCGMLFGAPKLLAPLSGQRAARYAIMKQMVFANNYGCEISQNIVLAKLDATVLEVEVEMANRIIGKTLKGFLHRGRQFKDITSTFLAAIFGRNGDFAFQKPTKPMRVFFWAAMLLAVLLTLFLTVSLATVIFGVVLALLGIPLALYLSLKLRCCKKNYLGSFIPALGGTIFFPLFVFLQIEFFVIFVLNRQDMNFTALLFPLYCICWMIIGLYDDVSDDNEFKGFRGHILALKNGHLTSGFLKLALGGILSLCAAFFVISIKGHHLGWIFISAPLIALVANTINLLDLRPGRALKWWAFGLAIIATYHLLFGEASNLSHVIEGAILLVVFLAILYAPLDLSAQVMLGDVGSNLLGGLLGLIVILVCPPFVQAVLLFLFILLNAKSEKKSFTQIIADNKLLRFFDNLGR